MNRPEAYIYKIPILFGQMRLPLLSVAVAASEEQAKELAIRSERYAPARAPVENLGLAHDPTPRLIC